MRSYRKVKHSLQDNFAILGIHRQAAARFQGSVVAALGGGVLHSLADDAAQVAGAELAALTLGHEGRESRRGVAVGDALGFHAGLVLWWGNSLDFNNSIKRW